MIGVWGLADSTAFIGTQEFSKCGLLIQHPGQSAPSWAQKFIVTDTVRTREA